MLELRDIDCFEELSSTSSGYSVAQRLLGGDPGNIPPGQGKCTADNDFVINKGLLKRAEKGKDFAYSITCVNGEIVFFQRSTNENNEQTWPKK